MSKSMTKTKTKTTTMTKATYDDVTAYTAELRRLRQRILGLSTLIKSIGNRRGCSAYRIGLYRDGSYDAGVQVTVSADTVEHAILPALQTAAREYRQAFKAAPLPGDPGWRQWATDIKTLTTCVNKTQTKTTTQIKPKTRR